MVELKYKAEAAIAEIGQGAAVEVENRDAVDEEFSGIRPTESAENLEERGLAGATCADDGYKFALLYLKVNAFENLQGTEGLGDVVCENHLLF
jgi:hypothetical protein